jgi:mannose-6-phosphate isomerase-like protein (cupin superfamily)
MAPIAGLPSLLAKAGLAQSSAPPELHVVGAGEDRSGHPHSLGYSTLLFKVLSRETSGGLFLIEHRNLMPGGPPLHLHLNQEEWFFVAEGEVAIQVGEQRLSLHAGESVLAPRRVPHTFSSVGATPGHMVIAFTPAGKMEQFMNDTRDFSDLASQAEHFRRYDMELVGPSPFWKPQGL